MEFSLQVFKLLTDHYHYILGGAVIYFLIEYLFNEIEDDKEVFKNCK